MRSNYLRSNRSSMVGEENSLHLTQKMSNILLEKFEAIISIIFSSFFVKQCWLSDNGIAKQCPLVDNGSRTPSLFPIHAHLHTYTNRKAVYQKLLACLLLPMCNKVFEHIHYLLLFRTHYRHAFTSFGKQSHIRKSVWF